MVKKKVAIGSKGVDLLLNGGVPTGSITLIEGPPGIGKRDIACHFLQQGKNNNEKVGLAYRGYGPQDVGAYTAGRSQCPKEVTLIECSGGTEAPATIRCNIGELFTVTDAIKKYCKENPKSRLVIDILSDISMLHKTQQMYKFLEQITTEIKASKITTIMVVDEGMQEKSALVGLEHVCDIVLQLRLWEEGLNVTPVVRIKKYDGEQFDHEYFVYDKLQKGIKMVKTT